jgi:hypothetical protein
VVSATVRDRRVARAARAVAALGDALAEHEVLSVQCAHGHHVAAVYATAEGLVYRSITGPHAHGRKDRVDEPHHGSRRGATQLVLLTAPGAPAEVQGWCDCGTWTISRSELVSDVRHHRRTSHLA